MKYFWGSTLYLLLCANTACAADLMDIYRQALENDPIFKAAFSTYMSSTESIPQARSALYPQIGITNQVGRYIVNASGGTVNAQQTYNGHQWTISASQAVFNYQAWSSVQQAKASVKASQAVFNDAAQDLILRVARAYFSILLSNDTLDFAEAKKRANARQLEEAQQRFDVGLAAITSVYEARAAYDRSVAEVIAARNAQINQSENLRKLTNQVYDHIAALRDGKIPLHRPEPDNAEDWISAGLRQNYKLLSAKYSMEAARDNIKVQASSGWPSLAIQSNTFQQNNQVVNSSVFLPSKQTSSNVVLSLNYPLFQGGLIESKTRQAQHNYRTTGEQFEQAYRDVIVNSRISFNTIIDGNSKVEADRRTVESQRNSLESTEAQFQVGTRTMVDVVNAQQKLFEAQRQLAEDQYNLIYALLLLKYYAGTLSVQDLEEVNTWLTGTQVSGFMENKPSAVKPTKHHHA